MIAKAPLTLPIWFVWFNVWFSVEFSVWISRRLVCVPVRSAAQRAVLCRCSLRVSLWNRWIPLWISFGFWAALWFAVWFTVWLVVWLAVWFAVRLAVWLVVWFWFAVRFGTPLWQSISSAAQLQFAWLYAWLVAMNPWLKHWTCSINFCSCSSVSLNFDLKRDNSLSVRKKTMVPISLMLLSKISIVWKI